MKGRILGLRVGESVLLVATLVATAAASRHQRWDVELLALLFAFAIVAELDQLSTQKMHLSASFLALVLAMILLGPAPAVAMSGVLMVFDAVRRRGGLERIVSNVSIYTCFALVGSLAFRALDGREALMHRDGRMIPVIIAVYFIANLLNFLLVATDIWIVHGQSPLVGFRQVWVPLLPVEIAASLLTVGVAFTYATYGAAAVVLIGVIALVFQRLIKVAVQASERGEQLEQRNRELAQMQFGLISTMIKTLALRDNMTARHSAAVARYSRALAAGLGLPDAEQETIHTAALFHDIGKFIFPDTILLADSRLTPEDLTIVRQHPAVGAELVSGIDGYGPIADIIRSHHERMDGLGYPDGLLAVDIPVGSRIIAIADVYDVITARDTYRTPVSTQEAFAELRRSAGTQLDSELVEIFIGLVEHNGLMFRHGSAADFEAELALERRVRDYAEPAVAA